MTLSEKQQIFTFNIHLLIQEAFRLGFKLTFGEVYRTPEQQKIYFDIGRSKTMDSRHLQRLAVDFNIFKDGVILFQDKNNYEKDVLSCKVLGDFWLSLNTSNRWGADWDKDGNPLNDKFRDPYHFENIG
jgi:peptidoglycan L-alanyl-D-glutamate endopeptidase CwlK